MVSLRGRFLKSKYLSRTAQCVIVDRAIVIGCESRHVVQRFTVERLTGLRLHFTDDDVRFVVQQLRESRASFP